MTDDHVDDGLVEPAPRVYRRRDHHKAVGSYTSPPRFRSSPEADYARIYAYIDRWYDKSPKVVESTNQVNHKLMMKGNYLGYD